MERRREQNFDRKQAKELCFSDRQGTSAWKCTKFDISWQSRGR
jgi:hypothetical protein